MNHRFACLVVAGLAIAADPRADVSASVSQRAPIVEVLVGGTPQRQYLHQGRSYVEAIRGREYAIRLRNPYSVRVAVALSVDGLNTIDARQTSARNARKWVLDPYETVTISGWQTSQTEARRFEFTTEEHSYGQALGKTANLGVISAVFFRERVPVVLSRDSVRQEAAPASPVPSDERSNAAAPSTAGLSKRADEEYAATGMGRRTDHAVTQVWLDLEDAPAQTMNVRYEFRSQLVRLGILPPVSRIDDPLDRRERARGFEPAFAPVPPSIR
jgi:hypothetical protein